MNRWIITLAVSTAVGIATGRTPGTGAEGDCRPLRQQPGCGKDTVSARRAGRQGQRREADAPPAGAVNPGPFDPATWKYGTGVQSAGRREDLESGEAEDDAGRQGDRRHALQRDRSGDLLRDGQRRLRLHLDRDAARRARLGAGWRACGAPARTRRRCPACASPTPTSARSSTRSTPARSSSSCRRSTRWKKRSQARNWTYFPPLGGAATAAARRSTPACGAACPAATATRSTTTSC